MTGAPLTERVELRDGRVALIGPLYADDRLRYLSGMQRLSAESVYRRFMTPIGRVSESQLRYLLDVDHHDHEALLAVDEDTGEAVGVARFVRLADAPDTAEAAVAVVDDWHGYGLGKAICRLLANRARQVGITRFEATLLLENRPMMALLRSLGRVETVSVEGGATTVFVSLPGDGG